MAKFIDLSGQRFGKLLVLYRSSKIGEPIKFMCKCDCGKEKEIRGNDLRSGKTTSCGCTRRQKAKQNKKDLVGKKFGKLTVLQPTEERYNRSIIWRCKCDCGNIWYSTSTLLVNGKVKSCGCLKSQGEEIISKILKDNNITFETQKTFDSCVFPTTKAKAKFDFFVNNQYIIEFDGKQHFNEGGWGEPFELIEYRDLFKNNWCKENNIPLIRIPYTHLKEITIKDLKLNSSNFIMKGQ